eukprot:4537553-Prymnesium_polylepis.1
MIGGVPMRDGCGRRAVVVAHNIQHGLAMLFERLARQDLREDVGRVDLSRYQLDCHGARAAHLAHIEELAVDVAG